MDKLEEKIFYKSKNIFDAYEHRKTGMGDGKGNKKQFLIDMTNAMLRIIKAEVNIRLQEEKHHPENNNP